MCGDTKGARKVLGPSSCNPTATFLINSEEESQILFAKCIEKSIVIKILC